MYLLNVIGATGGAKLNAPISKKYLIISFLSNLFQKDSNTDLDCLGNGKKSICLNLKTANGIKIARKLIQTSDVSIEPFRAGVMEQLGLGPDVLLKDNPRLIYARLTGFGQTGPYAKKAGHDINFLALSGLLSMFGRKHEKPSFPVNLAADFGGGGLMCTLGILLALFERERSGKGQIVDASMVNGTAYLGSYLYRSQETPLLWGQPRGCNILDSGAPFYEVYETKDGKYIAVGAIETTFYKDLLVGLNLSESEAPQYDFATTKEKFKEKFLEKTRDEWCKVFEKLDACVMPVLGLTEAPQDPHNKSQSTFIQSNTVTAPRPAPNLSRTPAQPMSLLRKPEIGEHTEEILIGLGYDKNDIAKFNAQNVVYYPNNKSKL